MKIIGHSFICPVCRFSGTIFLAEVHKPPFDEIAPDKRSCLCSVCERWFVNAMYRTIGQEVREQSGVEINGVCLSAMRKEAQVAGEPGPEATVGTDHPSGLLVGMHGMQPDSRNRRVPGGERSPQEDAPSTLRGATVLPAELPE